MEKYYLLSSQPSTKVMLGLIKEYLESLHRKDKESELSEEHLNEDEKKCANNYSDWGKKKSKGKIDQEAHKG